MSQIVMNFFRGPLWPLPLAVVLLGALGPPLLRARGARALWLIAVVIWLAVALASGLLMPVLQGFLVLFAVWLALVVGLVFLLARLAWPVPVRSFVAAVAAIVLPPAMTYALLYLAMKYGHGAP